MMQGFYLLAMQQARRRTLPSAEQQALADGITLDNAEELARLLENYSS